MKQRLIEMMLALIVGVSISARAAAAEGDAKTAPNVSYYRDIRPILQANCQGCHQPAKAKGGYIMTNFKGLLAGGDTEGTAIVPDHLEQSSLLKMVTPQNVEARMPQRTHPPTQPEVAVI